MNGWKTSKILIILYFQKGQGSKNDAKINLRATQVNLFTYVAVYGLLYEKFLQKCTCQLVGIYAILH